MRGLLLSKILKVFFIGLFVSFIGVQSVFATIAQVGTAQTAYGAGVQTITVNRPAGVTIGDVLIINVVYGGNGATNIPSVQTDGSSWTVVSSVLSGGNGYRGAILYKVVTNTWETSYTITISNWPIATYCEASVVAFRGVDTTNPVDAIGNFTTTSGVSGNTISPTGITTVTPNALVIMLGMSYRSDNNNERTFSSWIANSSTTFTELYDYGGGRRVDVGAATSIKATPGPTGDGTITLSGDNTYRGAIIMALRPSVTCEVGNPAVSGDNVWNVYAYQGNSIDLSGITYSGYYTESNFTFSSESKWDLNGSPSNATGYNGCTVSNDNHTFVYKRKGFPPGVYQITVGHDDAYRLYIDGDLKASATGWDAGTPVVLGTNYTLGSTTEIELRIAEANGGSRGSLTFIAQCTRPDVPALSASLTEICSGESTTLSFIPGNLNDAAYWQWYSGSCGGTPLGQGTSLIVSPTNTTTYYARGEGNSCDGYCGEITITVNDIPGIASSPSPTNAATDVCYAGPGAVTSVSWATVAKATSYDVYFGAGSLPGTPINVTGTSYLTGTLQPNTTYYWKVVPKNACGSASGSSTWSFTTRGSTCASYCAFNFTNVDPITKVVFGGISNTSSALTTSPAYEDFTSVSTSLVRGQNNTITVEGNTQGNYTDYFVVFIDWNQNGTLNDAGETFNIGTITNSTGTDGKQASVIIPIPTNAALGSTRMRVIQGWNRYNTDPCTALTNYGQIEDYTLNIIPPCTDGSITLSSGAGTNIQTVCSGTAITPITYTIGGGATGATVSDLPPGVTHSVVGSTLTITGTPGASSNYTVTTTGTPGPCQEASVSGSFTVNPLPNTGEIIPD